MFIPEKMRAAVQTSTENDTSLDAVRAAELREKAAAGVPKAALACQFGISRETVYAYLRG